MAHSFLMLDTRGTLKVVVVVVGGSVCVCECVCVCVCVCVCDSLLLGLL